MLGKEVVYVDIGLEVAQESMAAIWCLSSWYAEARKPSKGTFGKGLGDILTYDIERVTGHAARSFETFARDFTPVFVRGSQPIIMGSSPALLCRGSLVEGVASSVFAEAMGGPPVEYMEVGTGPRLVARCHVHSASG